MRVRPLLILVPVVLSCLSLASARASGNDLTGQKAPQLTLSDGLNGASAATSFETLKGKVVCLKFWLTHCPICRGTLPEFQALHDRYARAGVVCLAVVIDNAEGVAPYLREKGWTFQVGCDPDGRNASRYGVQHYPADYVVGPDGVVRASNGFPRAVIEEELRKVRVAELGPVPDALKSVRDAVEDGDYGQALRLAEAAAKAEGATPEAKAVAAKVLELARSRQDNRFARAEALRKAGNATEAKAEFERIVKDFTGTSLEAKAKEKAASTGG